MILQDMLVFVLNIDDINSDSNLKISPTELYDSKPFILIF